MIFHEVVNMVGVVEERRNGIVTLMLRVGQTALYKFKEYETYDFKLKKKFIISKAAAEAFAIYRRSQGLAYFAEGNTVRNAENNAKYYIRYSEKLRKINIVKEVA